MPEILSVNPEIAGVKNNLFGFDDFVGVNWEGEPIDDKSFSEAKKKIGAIAIGAEYIILPHPTNPDQLEAISFLPISPERAKLIFYNHRILSVLFPRNFPHFFAAFGANAEKEVDMEGMLTKYNTGTIRQRIEGRPFSHYMYDYDNKGVIKRIVGKIKRIVRKEQDVKYPFSEVLSTISELGCIPIIDDHGGNFIIGDDGGEYYVDTVTKTLSDFQPDKTLAYMKQKKFSNQDINVVMSSVKRIVGLREKLGKDTPNLAEIVRMMVA